MAGERAGHAGDEVEGEAPVAPLPAAGVVTYADALALLHNRVDLERVRVTGETKHQYKLDRMRALCEALGHPEKQFRSVHVAGTKGKGSTCEMLTSALTGCGYTVGVYTSPHLADIRERIRLGSALISEGEFVRHLRTAAEAAEGIEAEHGRATFFELMTAMAFLHFADQAVDLAVIEVGLGGRLDCTNVIEPAVAAVALIGYDHMQILGETLPEIAAQKGGIYKPGAVCLTYDQEGEVIDTLRRCAEEAGEKLLVLGRDVNFSYRVESEGPNGIEVLVNFSGSTLSFDAVSTPLKGEHQALNLGLVLAIVDQLARMGMAIDEQKVINGLDRTQLAGRFEIVRRQPTVVLDGAHNPESIAALMKTLPAHVSYDSLLVIFGCAADKDIKGILKYLVTAADKVIFTKAEGNMRAAEPKELARIYHKLADGKQAMTAPNLAKALDLAHRMALSSDAVCITGSFYLVGEAKRLSAARKAAR
ncbi:MAG: bifunctional folylpolyglutamate synthase/dihydrofolate synthase [bacterium]